MEKFPRQLTFVIPWYGANLGGGAETLCREFCERLNATGISARVLTTCCASLQTNWNKNSYSEGATLINNVEVIRFKVRPGNHKTFNDANHTILLGYTLSPEEEENFFRESINSDSLLNYIKEKCEKDCLIFLPYLYGLTYYGSQIHPKQSFILPCLHREGYAFLPSLKEMFNSTAGLIFNTEEEMRFAKEIYGLDNIPTAVIGMGIDPSIKGDAERFRKKFKISDPFILYVGRKDETKNVPFLIKLFSRYISEEKEAIKLILVGPGEIEIPEDMRENIIDLGFIDSESKADAHSAASVLCQPSLNESFSISIMESWREGVPVLVNSFCDVTRSHCEKSDGGLFFKDYLEFKECLNHLFSNENSRRTLGRQGKKYVESNYRWEIILNKFLKFLQNNLF